MIQFNLLPDVKKEYIKAKRTKRIIYSTSMLSALIAIGVTLLLLSIVQVVQKKSINDLTNDIEADIASLQAVDDLNKILTIQYQLETLPELHEQKPKTSRIFSYLTQITPEELRISSVNLDIEESTLTIEGSAPDIASVNRYADTLKFAKFVAVDAGGESDLDQARDEVASLPIDDASNRPFSEVSTDLSRSEESASYEIRLIFEPELFDNTKEVALIIPDSVTTRSVIGRPNLGEGEGNDNPLFESVEGEE